jgi:hypothetical protein
VQGAPRVLTDDDGAFVAETGALLARRKIAHVAEAPGRHARLSRLDRYVGTLRGQLRALFASTRGNVWYEHLGALTLAYNTKSHRSLREVPLLKKIGAVAPADVTPRLERAVQAHDLSLAPAVRRRVDALGNKKGDRVRVLLRVRGSLSTKAEISVWNSSVHRVVAREGANLVRLDSAPDGYPQLWPVHELQRLPPGPVLQPRAPKARASVAGVARALGVAQQEMGGVSMRPPKPPTVAGVRGDKFVVPGAAVRKSGRARVAPRR